ncbi:AAA domain containing protein [uncultured Caudovirales phage]|uniref:AAA domain containing protein n=1 Tax=uncultured Caudovirales phage TaxID=2100421 RepID=A0A6J5MA57_9CAUD|nr:AAA domain containing protein [uncultured Caudovirales phage]
MPTKTKTVKTSNVKSKTKQMNKTKRVARKTATTRVAKTTTTRAKKDFVVGFTNEIYKPVLIGKTFALMTTDNTPVTNVAGITRARIKQANDEGKAIRGYVGNTGKMTYKLVEMDEFKMIANTIDENTCDSVSESFETHEQLKSFIHEKGKMLRPAGLFIEELKWKYLLRSAVRGKNIMMTGPTGCGKTLAAQSLVRSLKRPDFYFNLGATQDPRATLIGNTHFNKETGTFFSESAFVKAIKTPNAIILLDEISRSHPEAWNILMTVLDSGQRYLRLDEAEGSPIVKVASGVTFIATANIGNEYTSTRIMDRAIMDRFVQIEMDLLDKQSEYELLKFKFPDADDYSLNALAEIADTTRQLIKSDASKISTIVSTRVNVEAAGLIYDGFSLMEAAEIAILPYFSNDGGLDSERVFMKQVVQKYIKTDESDNKLFTDLDDTESNDPQTIVW